jgi:hypothetical protein
MTAKKRPAQRTSARPTGTATGTATGTGDTDRVAVENVNHPGKSRLVHAGDYHVMRHTLLKVLPRRSPGLTYVDMSRAVVAALPINPFQGAAKADWWLKTVQLDLEAKGIVAREKTKPTRWRRA